MTIAIGVTITCNVSLNGALAISKPDSAEGTILWAKYLTDWTFWNHVRMIAMAIALAHALELPGKMRLSKEAYFATQPIYYPGFTIGGGVGEFGGLIATLILLVLTPYQSTAFWLTLVALFGLIGMQTVYWLWIHPINQFWLEGEMLNKASSRFFSFGTNQEQSSNEAWANLRNQWEYAHVVRTGLGFISLIAMTIALQASRGMTLLA